MRTRIGLIGAVLGAAVGIFAMGSVAAHAQIKFSDLWKGHPLNNSVAFPARMLATSGAKLKGTPSFANQCAIRMGVALREAGVTLGQLGGVRVSWYHPKDKMYVLNSQELGNALARAGIQGLGKVEKYTGEDAKKFYSKMFGRTGIVFFKDYWSRSVRVSDGSGGTTWVEESQPSGDHIDVWNGYRTSAAWLMEWFSWLGYYSNYINSKEIWFWEVK